MLFDKKNLLWKTILVTFPLLTLLLSINQIFRLQIFGFLPMVNAYLYLLLSLNLSLVFILFPVTKKVSSEKVQWYDAIMFVLTIVINIYFAFNSELMISKAWELFAPTLPSMLSVLLWFLVLEAVRRTNGKVVAGFCFVFSLYPLYAGVMPSFLRGQNFDFISTARMHVLSINSILGIPTQVVGTLLVGFMLFGVVLQYTGGGKFFMDFAMSTCGHLRGGPAKVAVIASALFGSLSGSAISNVITSGSVTIPAMKKTGYKDYYAAAIEACASTGGTIMPPVMGAAAFVMASFLNVGYSTIVLAAIIPSLLYYMGLFFQIDAYALKNGIKGIPKDQLPNLKDTIKAGWYNVLSFIVLFYFIFSLRMESRAPFIASFVLLVLTMIRKETRFNFEKFRELIIDFGKLMATLTAILTAVGLIIGGLTITGVALAFSRELVHVVSGTFQLLLAGAATSFILGFGLTSSAVYILLSIVLAPALIRVGVNPLAAHFFILYWGILSFITPPVALASYAAAGVAGADPTKTGVTGMRLGFVSYIVPFVFVYNPALLFQGTLLEVAYGFVMTAAGIFLVAVSMEGFSPGIGKLSLIKRVILIASGILMMFPFVIVNLIGVGISLTVYIVALKSVKKHEIQIADGGL
jgi:TRAP transporter 4TM/12TM fusion protein